jgi:hypothetical protein
MKLRGQVAELERLLSEVQSTFEREKALWEGKGQFLEQQRDTYKRDLVEAQRKFEITLDQLNKRGSLDKDKHESQQQQVIRMIEAKYQGKIKEMMDTHNVVVSEA